MKNSSGVKNGVEVRMLNTKQLLKEHGEFLRKMADASVGTMFYSIWARAYDRWIKDQMDQRAQQRSKHEL